MGQRTRVKKQPRARMTKLGVKVPHSDGVCRTRGLGAGCPARLYRRYIVTSGRAATAKLGTLGKDERLRCTWIAAKHNIHSLTKRLSASIPDNLWFFHNYRF